MGKKKKNKASGDVADAPAPVAAAATEKVPVAATGAPRPLATPRSAERTLMDTLEPDTTPVQILAMIGGMLAFPIVVSLLVKLAVLPLLFPSW